MDAVGNELAYVPVGIERRHSQLVEQALASGKPVPAEVLADYPDLKAPAPNAPVAGDTEKNTPPAAPVPTTPAQTQLAKPGETAGKKDAAADAFIAEYKALKGLTRDQAKLVRTAEESGDFPAILESLAERGQLKGIKANLSQESLAAMTLANVDAMKMSKVGKKPATVVAEAVTSKDGSRYAIDGLHYDKENQAIVATNGRTMFIIPSKVEGDTRTVAVRNDPQTGRRKGEVLEGRFPKWQDVIPDITKATAIPIDMAHARAVSIAAEQLTNANTNSKGQVPVTLDDTGFGYNPAFVRQTIEAFSSLGETDVAAYVAGPKQPVVVIGKNTGAKALIMPIELDDDTKAFALAKAPAESIPTAPTPPAPDRTGKGGRRNQGSTELYGILLEEAEARVSETATGVRKVGRGATDMVRINTGRAAKVIEDRYGDTGTTLANDVREVAFQSDRRFEKQWMAMQEIINPLSQKDRIELAKMGLGMIAPESNPRIAEYHKRALAVMDMDMGDADKAGFRRSVAGEWRNLKGTGRWYPQTLNAVGRMRMQEASQAGLGSPHIKAIAEKMVADGVVDTEEQALARMLDWNNSRIRSTHGYFEKPRTWTPPEAWLELGPENVLPFLIRKNANMIAAANQWGVDTEGEGSDKQLQFQKLKTMLKDIESQYGSRESEMLKKWARTNFGLSNDIPESIENAINTINHYMTVTRLGYRGPSILRNLTQGNVNLFTAPLSAHLKAGQILMFRKWNAEYTRLYNEARRSGAVTGQKELAEVEKGRTGKPRFGARSMKGFGWSETSNHMRAALIGRIAAEKHIADLAAMKNGGTLRKILTHIKYLSVNPEAYLTRRIKKKMFTNEISDAQVDAIWSGKRQLTLDDYERIMHRISVDTQFQQNLATRSIPWKTNPMLRLLMKFKTFGINQTRLIYEDAIKEALAGTFAPLAKYMLFSTMAGELWNLIRDAIMGGDNSLTSTMVNRPEDRNAKNVALKLANDFVDGAGVGILADMMYGVTNFVVGPAKQTWENVMDWAANLDNPGPATMKLIRKELAVSRDIEGLMSRADTLFFNSNN